MVKIGVLGRIKSGDDQGKYVKIQELSDDVSSYLVLTATDPSFQFFGGDDWVEDYDSLQRYFREARWEVEWENQSLE